MSWKEPPRSKSTARATINTKAEVLVKFPLCVAKVKQKLFSEQINKGKKYIPFHKQSRSMQCYSTSTMDNKKCFSEVLSCPAPTGVRELTKGEELDLYRKHQSATIVQHLLSQRI